MFLLGSGGKHFEDELRNAGAEIIDVEIKRFPDGEKYVRVMGNGGEEATVVSSTFYPQDEKIVELLLLGGDALREKGFGKLKLVVPYFAYSRQDRVTKDGEPISVRAVMRTLGIYYEELYVFDIHNPETLKFFPGKAVNVSPARVIGGEYFREKLGGDGLVLAPDRGGHLREPELLRESLASSTATLRSAGYHQQKLRCVQLMLM